MSTIALYRQHLATLDRWLADALERAARRDVALDGVLFHAGREETYHADDAVIPFWSGAHFARWVPLAGPEHAVLARPGTTPVVVRVQPRDYWYDTSPAPPSFWEEAVDLREVESFAELPKVLGSLDRVAYVGNSPAAAAEAGIPAESVDPTPLLAPLDWYRAVKTDFEVEMLAEAAVKGGAGHRAGRRVWEQGGSERDVFWAFLLGADQVLEELPFGAIVAFDGKAAILHYQHKRRAGESPGRVLLLDAGARHGAYASDITRTWVRPDADPAFRALVEGLDAYERRLCALVTPGRPYTEIHLAAHRFTAELLSAVGIVKGSAEEALDRGVTRAFFPHGVGHHLGIQVHDVAGRQASPDGGTNPPPEGHPYLRNTRVLEPGHYVTIEPGIYFIPMLLDPLRASSEGSLVDWALVERLLPHGGVRIEDNILCTDGEPRDLTRPHIPGPRGE